nr:hypothetical protein CFP56_43471 [Quercus suber]
MEVEPSSEAKELVDSFVALEEEGDECCVVEDVEAPMVLDAASEHDVNLEYSESLDFDPSKCLSQSCSSPGMGLSDPVNVLINDSNGFDKLVFTAQNSVNYIGRGSLSTFGIDAQSLLRVTLCTSCKCPGHDGSTCLWLKGSSQHTSLDNQNQKIAYTTSPCR